MIITPRMHLLVLYYLRKFASSLFCHISNNTFTYCPRQNLSLIIFYSFAYNDVFYFLLGAITKNLNLLSKQAKTVAIESNVAMEQGGNPGDRARGYIILRRRVAAPFGWTTVCLLITALLVMCIGIMCGLSIYKKYASAPMYRFRTGW